MKLVECYRLTRNSMMHSLYRGWARARRCQLTVGDERLLYGTYFNELEDLDLARLSP